MPDRRISIEECPLRKNSQCQKSPTNLKGPLRVIRLCLLGITLPALLMAIPLYMRYHVYGHQLYPLAMSDMRLLDNRISTTWCQRQLVRVNTTFNAFLMPKSPQIDPRLKPLSMVRHLELEDDTKEYWGFYLLKGSSVTVSSCVRWPGASLIVIRGHKHLHECAYIGDNSSEELDELMEAIKENPELQQNEAPANQPQLMKRHREEVEFHHPSHKNSTQENKIPNTIDSKELDTDHKTMGKMLETLQEKTSLTKPKGHTHRNSTIAKDETKNLNIQSPNSSERPTPSEEVVRDIITKLRGLGKRGSNILSKINEKYLQEESDQKLDEHLLEVKGRHYAKPPVNYNDNIDHSRKRRDLIIASQHLVNLTEHDEENNLAIEEGFNPDGIADHRGTFNETTLNDMSNSEFWSSFSSSEEALLNCAGLILNLPLSPHHKCDASLPEEQAEEAYLANRVTYKVPTNGYYFFVFNSENEIQTNYLRIKFHLEKTVYNTSNPIAFCTNSTQTCAMDLKFFSSEKLVMELPVKENDSLWNEEFIVVSECEPRTAIYAACVIAVPVLVILFAFS